jgi:hypothetical protein
MTSINYEVEMPQVCSCGSFPVVDFLPATVEWRVTCPKCAKQGRAAAEMAVAVSYWNSAKASLASMQLPMEAQSAAVRPAA